MGKELKKLSRSLLIIGLLVFVASALIPVNSFADVDVYGEGAYTESDLADINGPNILSAGVKLTDWGWFLCDHRDDGVLFLLARAHDLPDATGMCSGSIGVATSAPGKSWPRYVKS